MMKLPFRLGLSVFFLATVLPPLVTADEEYLLRYRYRKGDVREWNVQQSLRITLSLRGKTEITETLSRSSKIWRVVDIAEDGTATFEYKVGNVRMERSQTGKDDAKYDSRVDEEIPAAFRPLEGTIGVPLAELTIGPLGEMKKKTVITNYAGAGEENRIAIPLPKEPIAVGKSWEINTPIEVPQTGGTVKKIAAAQSFTLESVETGVATIKFETKIRTPITDPALESQIIDKYSHGFVKLDLDAGHLISQETTIDRTVVDFQGAGSSIRHHSRFTECCCGLKSCEICSQ